jgi:hypothetical protein
MFQEQAHHDIPRHPRNQAFDSQISSHPFKGPLLGIARLCLGDVCKGNFAHLHAMIVGYKISFASKCVSIYGQDSDFVKSLQFGQGFDDSDMAAISCWWICRSSK